MENIGIVVPDEGYLERVRELCDQYGVLLVFDEVKTGLTAGPQGAAQRLGVIPDLICLAKSIGGASHWQLLAVKMNIWPQFLMVE